MNKLLLICGMIMLGTVSTPQEGNLPSECDPQEVYSPTDIEVIKVAVTPTSTFKPAVKAPKLVSRVKVTPSKEINLDDIIYIEEEPALDLGFDTADYLPENFDPNKVYFDLNSVEFVEAEEELALGLDTKVHLPKDFNAYASPEDFMAVSYIEEEQELDLGFDTANYLPEGFDPYEVYFDLNSIEYIEEEEEIEIDFDTTVYLPEGFDPYSR